MKLDIVLPTKGRKEKLTNCLNSVFHSLQNIPIDLYIYFSIQSEYDENHKFYEHVPFVHVEMVEDYRVPEFWNGHLKRTKADAMCYINDDILFYEDTIEQIFQEYEDKFPDYDGVMGIRQANLPENQTVEGAFGVIGSKYAERFPDKKVFCPDYERFHCDHELWQNAQRIGKFYFCSTARIDHLHPVTNRALEDDTHKDVRKWLSLDRLTYKKRQSLDYLWGKDFNLINAKENI